MSNSRQLMLSELTLNPSVKAEDEIRLSRQSVKIYHELQRGPVWTNKLISIARQYNARLFELRQWLARHGLTIDKTGGPDIQGNFKYEIVQLNGSRYEKNLQRKGLI